MAYLGLSQACTTEGNFKVKSSYIISIVLFIGFGAWLWYFPESPQRLYEGDVLRVGTNAEYPPFEYMEDGEIVGLDIEIVEEIGKRLKKHVEKVNMDFDMLMPQLQFGSIDIIAAGLSVTPEKSQQALFTTPYLKNDPFLIVTLASEPPVVSMSQLFGKKVVVNQGFTAELYMKPIRGPLLYALPTVAEAFMALEQKRAYAFVTAASVVGPFFKKHGREKFRTTRIPGQVENYSLAISKKDPELFKKVQAALIGMKRDGTLKKIMKKWGL